MSERGAVEENVPLEQRYQEPVQSEQTSTTSDPRQTLVGEAQSRLMQQTVGQQVQTPTGLPSEQMQTQPRPELRTTVPEEIAQRTIEVPATEQAREEARFTPIRHEQRPVPGGVREEIVGEVQPTHKKVHIVEQRPGEAILIKQPPSYFYQSHVYPGMRKPQQPIRDATIEYFNSFVAKNTHCLLGRTGLKVSRISLGTMNFGKIDPTFGERPGQVDEDEAHQILDRFVELGGNCIDTADFFPWFGSCGESERLN